LANRCGTDGAGAGVTGGGLTAAWAGVDDFSASFGCAGSVARRFACPTDSVEGFALPRGFRNAAFSAGFFLDSGFLVEGASASPGAAAVCVAPVFGA
jgi:hypothetical protein